MSKSNDATSTPPIALRPVREGLLTREDAKPGEPLALRASRCERCDLVAFPYRTTCEQCFESTDNIALSTRATLIAHTEVIHPPPDALVEVPYGVGLVRFPEGISILGLLDDALRKNPEVGAEVESYAYEAFPGGLTYAYRRPVSVKEGSVI
jgi:uncharacterized OB-fold protein